MPNDEQVVSEIVSVQSFYGWIKSIKQIHLNACTSAFFHNEHSYYKSPWWLLPKTNLDIHWISFAGLLVYPQCNGTCIPLLYMDIIHVTWHNAYNAYINFRGTLHISTSDPWECRTPGCWWCDCLLFIFVCLFWMLSQQILWERSINFDDR